MIAMKDKKTILYVDQALSFGGSIVVLASLVEALDKNNFRPVVVGEMSKKILDYHIKENAKIYIVPRLFNYLHWIKATTLIRRVRFPIIRKFIIYTLSVIRSCANMIYIIRLARVMLKEKIDLVHVNNGMSNLEPVIAAMLLRRKYIVHFHGVEKPGLVQKLFLPKVPKFIVISKYLQKALGENGFPEKRMVVIPNPVQGFHTISEDSSDIRKQYGLEEKDKVFGIVGRIIQWKGHVEFLKAAFIVLEKVTDARALIVGDFSDGDEGYQKKITVMVDESGFKDKVIMTGYVENVSNIYSVMDVCVHTSIEPEPFGLVIIEAMANGVPVVASNIGAPEEIIIDNVNGYLVSPNSTEKLASRIINLLSDEELKEKIGERGRLNVRDNYQSGQYARLVENIYSEVLE